MPSAADGAAADAVGVASVVSGVADIVELALASGVAVVVEVEVELWLREMTRIARRAIPAITVTTTREDEPL